MQRYKQMPMPPSQIMLFGMSVEEALPEDSDVQAFKEVMDCLDYSQIECKCCATGAPPYPPEVMVKILGYAYSKRIRSSRKIEVALKVDVRFMWLAGAIAQLHKPTSKPIPSGVLRQPDPCPETTPRGLAVGVLTSNLRPLTSVFRGAHVSSS